MPAQTSRHARSQSPLAADRGNPPPRAESPVASVSRVSRAAAPLLPCGKPIRSLGQGHHEEIYHRAGTRPAWVSGSGGIRSARHCRALVRLANLLGLQPEAVADDAEEAIPAVRVNGVRPGIVVGAFREGMAAIKLRSAVLANRTRAQYRGQAIRARDRIRRE